jgi:catechol 2,3-dioxygenase-like lactoylglutathione lyase family enzyme
MVNLSGAGWWVMIERIDHFVLTVRSLETTLGFYERVLGFTREIAPGRPAALKFGQQKFNVHAAGRTFEPNAAHPTPGSSDFCLITRQPIDDVIAHLKSRGVIVELGPVARTGALGAMTSIYFRDPDDNLVEIARYES